MSAVNLLFVPSGLISVSQKENVNSSLLYFVVTLCVLTDVPLAVSGQSWKFVLYNLHSFTSPAFPAFPASSDTLTSAAAIKKRVRFILPNIIMNIFGFVFVFHSRLLCRNTHRHYTQRYNMFGQAKHLLHKFCAVHIRMQSRPHCA